ncbi:uncharacterized protein LOC122860153 [Aphidius gifuensis]|uniref:uncharacterized protein LOC122860153 n=1 Tax=Aphidius gifuensis TaxID=684658 RepID=UPI001CDCCD7E|nr:uncharacterized protein LOC122860153 [Aphidius gifuensis]
MRALNFFIFIAFFTLINGARWGRIASSKEIEYHENLLHYWNAQFETLGKIAGENWFTLKNQILFDTLATYKSSMSSSSNDKKHNDICLEQSKKQLLMLFLTTISDNHNCLNNEIKNLNEITKSIVMSNNLLKTYPRCNNMSNTSKQLLNCIDDERKFMKNDCSGKNYLNALRELKIKNTEIVKSLNSCIANNVTTISNNSLKIKTNEFNTCINKKINTEDKIVTEKKINSSVTIKHSTTNDKKLLTLYNNQLSQLESNFSEEKFNVNQKISDTKNQQFNLIKLIKTIYGRNNTCCLNLPQEDINRAAEIAIDRYNKCYKNESSNYNESIISYVKTIKYFSNCFKNNNSSLILKCIDDTSLTDGSNEFKIFNEYVKDYLKSKFNSVTLSLTNCFEKAKINFSSSVTFANLDFDECIMKQQDNNGCHVAIDDVDDVI